MDLHQILTNQLHQYLRENNPEILLQLEEQNKVTEYLSLKVSTVNDLLNEFGNGQPAYIIEEACMTLLTQDLRPSKFNYIILILEEEFANKHQKLQETGVIRFEVMNLVSKCQSTFEHYNFSEANEDDRFLRYAIIGTISEYFESNK